MRSPLLIFMALAVAPGGCSHAPVDRPIVTVTASWPGMGAEVVADTVAAPIEEQIKGVEGMARIESESRNDGSYIAWVRFGPKSDAKLAVRLVQERVNLARPVLPEAVAQSGVDVKVGGALMDDRKWAVIALVDRGAHGRDALRGWSEAVVERLTGDGALVKPEVFPGPDKKDVRLLRIDRKNCDRLGVSEADVGEALRKAGGWAVKLDTVKKLTVTSAKGDEIPVAAVLVFEEVTGPAAVYRLDLYPAVRITGSPPKGKTTAEAARRCVELAEAERRKSNRPDSFAALNLTEQ